MKLVPRNNNLGFSLFDNMFDDMFDFDNAELEDTTDNKTKEN